MFVHDIQDMQDVVSAGFRTFSFQESVLSEVWDAFRALRLITGYLSTREEIVTFLQREMNISFPIRTKPYTYYLPESYLDSGDLMISTDFSGEDALVIFGTGGPIGHVRFYMIVLPHISRLLLHCAMNMENCTFWSLQM